MLARFNGYGNTGLNDPPCILYFDENLKAKALEIRDLVKTAQPISDERIKYVQRSSMPKLYQELADLSGIDVVVVLGKP